MTRQGFPEDLMDRMFRDGETEMAVFSAGMLAVVAAIDRLTDKLELVQNELFLLRNDVRPGDDPDD